MNRSKPVTQISGRKRNRPVIGILVDWLTSQYQVGLLSGILDITEKEDINVLCFEGGVLSSPLKYEAQRNMLYNLVSEQSVDGIIFFAGSIAHFIKDKELSVFLKSYCGIPCISIARELEGIPSVVIDNSTGMKLLLEHLIKHHGYKRLAIVAGHEDNLDAFQRYDTYVRVLAENNIPFDLSLVTHGKFSSQAGVDAVHLLLDERRAKFDAIIALNDEMALGIVSELRDRGINVPGDIPVVGFDNIDLARYSSPPLTTVDQPIFEIGKKSASLLLELMKGRHIPDKTVVDTELIVRESCGCSFFDTKVPVVLNPSISENYYTIRSAVTKDRIVREIAEVIKKIGSFGDESHLFHLIEKFIDYFISGIETGEMNGFLTSWDEFLYHLTIAGTDILMCDEVLVLLRKHIISNLIDRKSLLFAEDLCHNALSVIGRRAVQGEKFVNRKKEDDNYKLNTLRDNLLIISDVNRLSDVLAIDLPPIGIDSGYISLFRGKGKGAKKQAKLIFAYHKKKYMKIGQAHRFFPPEKFIPDEYYENEKRTLMVVEPLVHTSEFLGFMVLDASRKKYSIYEELRRTISRALHGALLFEEVKSHTRALKESEKGLRAITEAIPIPLVIAHLSDCRILYANILFDIFFQTEVKKNNRLSLLQFSGNSKDFDALVRKLDSVKQLSNVELPMRRSDGALVWVIASFQILTFRQERCFIAGFYDITERRRLEKEVLEISGREQQRIGQELHDDICQDLVGISTLIQAIGNCTKELDRSIAERADYVSELLNKTNEKTQQLAHGLFPSDTDEKGLAVMLRELAGKIETQHNISCKYYFDIFSRVTDNITILHLYRIAQEAVNNAVKHAKPRRIEIRFVSNDKRIEIEIKDDGIGIPSDNRDFQGMGLRSMQYRANMIGGKLRIGKNNDKGTIVTCVIEKNGLQ